MDEERIPGKMEKPNLNGKRPKKGGQGKSGYRTYVFSDICTISLIRVYNIRFTRSKAIAHYLFGN